ncbi:hypothetical protein SELMODRAFT_407674 [Selaginella moellendorffii]|uniref:Phytocyanin domain-containing protein n=1 Tax=Selaginella moellendorffii TaxID=88036 RepID=D8R6D9_SELML|nr:blue copper protein [Selaginella moellendorffii]EFJ32299.1 hypothetical protein SELMODRAFT_407674 [Selaginella moellendorffii]|eukprot:XP_002966272.1 blue copper protein [Selaginella moellendorffii]
MARFLVSGFAIALLLAAVANVCSAKSVMVGGRNQWSLGTNYASWAAGAGPFRIGDTLVFSYGGGRAGKAAAPHNVFLMKDQAHYRNCDFSGAVLLADPSKGTPGYKFTLKQKKAHYFACGVGNGFHCQSGMKFAVSPR